MSKVLSAYEKYKQDPRTPCRYADKCYQRNPAHHEQYKHPPKKTKRKNHEDTNPAKKFKNDDKSPERIKDEDEKKETISSSSSESECEQNKEIVNKLELNEEKASSSAVENTDLEDSNEATDLKEYITSKFLVQLPKDFYDFWDLCKTLKPTCPSEALDTIDLKLVGPYDVLAGKFKNIKKQPDEFLRHWRYYYDTPEVLTVIKGSDKTGYHIGYFFDSPKEPPGFLVSNHGTKDGVFTKMGGNIFAALSLYLEELKKNCDPFKKIQIGKTQNLIKSKAEELNLDLSATSKTIKERNFKVVAKSFNTIGIVVPYNKKTQLGYRDLAMSDKDLMTLLSKLETASSEQKHKYLSELQPVLTYANIALDECDFGTGVKLGWELLFHGIDSLNSTIAQFLGNSYRLLNKEEFAKIAEAHMKNRKKGCDLSVA